MLSNRLGLCEVCAANKSKYTCPKCEVKTCCLKCVNIHKVELECDGIRDRTRFIPLKKFSNLDLLSDIKLLDECSKNIESWKRDRSKACTSFERELPIHLYRLRGAARSRKTNLFFLTQNFTRHKENSSFLNWKTQIIYWRIEWIFPNAETIKFVDEKCDENLKLSKLVNKYLDPKGEPFYKKDTLVYYQTAGIIGVKILLKAERVKGSSKKFYELDVAMTLKENLAKKNLIEFPTIFIVFKEQSDIYKTIDSDEEIEEDPDNLVTNQRKRQWNKEEEVTSESTLVKKQREHKSLLFITEYSDEEMDFSDTDDES